MKERLPLTLIMPMAGLGTRVKAHFAKPKPFIDIEGRPLFSLALQGLPLEIVDEIIFVINELQREYVEHQGPHYFKKYLPRHLIPKIVFTETTSGQAETVVRAVSHMRKGNGLIIASSDTLVEGNIPKEIFEMDGAFGVFKSSNPALSFILTEGGLVKKAVEKEVISDMASSGIYFFRNPESLVKVFETKSSDTGESYISPMYNKLISDGLRIGFWIHDRVVPLGTSEEILNYIRN